MVVGWGCITSTKYEQRATLLRQGVVSVSEPTAENPNPVEVEIVEQHPITGQPIRVWTEVTEPVPDNPDTPEIDEGQRVMIFECQARGIITGGLNSQGTTERFTSKGDYENVDFVKLQVPVEVGRVMSRRDRVTNITDSRGNLIWREEEYGRMVPTVFDVKGVTPSVDPFGSVIEYFVLLSRSEVQGSSSG